MIEVELKFPVDDLKNYRYRLIKLQAQFKGEENHQDEYFSHPLRDFLATGESLRIRTIDNRVWLVYKSPKYSSSVKARDEVNIELVNDPMPDFSGFDNYSKAREFLVLLGFNLMAIVVKKRESYVITHNGHNIVVALDEVERLGNFVEIEVMADSTTIDDAEQTVLEIANSMNLRSPTEMNYFTMLLNSD